MIGRIQKLLCAVLVAGAALVCAQEAPPAPEALRLSFEQQQALVDQDWQRRNTDMLADGEEAGWLAGELLPAAAVQTSPGQRLLAELAASNPALSALLAGIGEPAALDQTDGLRVTLSNGEIVHFRPSGNAPELRCYAEATTQARAGELVQLGLQRILVRAG